MQLVIIALFVGTSAIGWVIRQIGEAKQRRAMELEFERRRREAARTGKDISEIAPETPIMVDPRSAEGARAEDLAQRRKRQLEELRRRQAQRAASQGSASGTTSGPGRGSPAPRAESTAAQRAGNQEIAARREALKRQQEIARQRTAQAQRQNQASRQAQTSRGSKMSERPSAGPSASRTGGPQRPGGSAQDRRGVAPPQRGTNRPPVPTAVQSGGEEEVHRLVPNDSESTSMSSDRNVNRSWGAAGGAVAGVTGVTGVQGVIGVTGIRRSGPVMLAGRPMTPTEWRRAFIVNEILGKPVSEREE